MNKLFFIPLILSFLAIIISISIGFMFMSAENKNLALWREQIEFDKNVVEELFE